MGRTVAEGLSFYYPRLLFCSDQMLAAMVLISSRFHHCKPLDHVLHVMPDVRDLLLARGLRFVHWRHPRSRVKVRTLFVHGLMEPSNIISQAIKLKLSSPGQTHSYMSGISHEYKGRNLDVLSQYSLFAHWTARMPSL